MFEVYFSTQFSELHTELGGHSFMLVSIRYNANVGIDNIGI